MRFVARVIGVETADMLVNEILSSHLRDGKAVARYATLPAHRAQAGNVRGAARHDPTGLALQRSGSRRAQGTRKTIIVATGAEFSFLYLNKLCYDSYVMIVAF